jgi:hypothetical protein
MSRGTAEERAKARVQHAAPGTLERTPPRDELIDEDDGGDDEEQVNQRSTDMDDEKPGQPQDDENDDQSPEHGNLLGMTADADTPPAPSMRPTDPLCNSRDQSLPPRPTRKEASGTMAGDVLHCKFRTDPRGRA